MSVRILRHGSLRILAVLLAVLGGLLITATPSQAAPSKVLNYQFQWQENYYYCGPAATRIALTGRGQYYSQNYIAGQLGTTTNGTNSAADTTRVLNSLGRTGFYETKWIPGNMATPAEISRLRWDLVYDIDRNYPIVANVVGTAVDTDGDAHSYPGGHYLAVVGYSNDGASAKLADPADANGYGWYWMETTRLAHWIAARGYSA
ncbi:C39 family peptidase [Streptomyces sp. NPDC002669]|uniref:C39 family peptidase n=1 Tax=Streptomyces sp. NPDC002669 TaxID=3364658 RepID=UPI0036986FB5